MRRGLALLVSLLVVLIATENIYAKGDTLSHIFKLYSSKPLKLEFTQISINSMSGQRIVRHGVLVVKPKEEMVFDYPDERIIIDNFKVVDYKNGNKTVYKLSGFNKVLFLLFVGKKSIDELFNIERQKGGYLLKPKYKSNIDSVFLIFNKHKEPRSLTIVDIYSNRIIYTFHDSTGKPASG